MITTYKGSAASLLDSTTIHKGAQLNCKRITDEFRERWKIVRTAFIDECSFFLIADMENIDKSLRLLWQRDKPYGGVSVVFEEYFYHRTNIKYRIPHT